MCYILSWPWSYTLLLTFNTVDSVVCVKFACELVFVNLPVFMYMFMLLPLSMWKLPVEKKNISLMTACSKIGVGGADALAPAGNRASETTMLSTAGVRHRKFFFYLKKKKKKKTEGHSIKKIISTSLLFNRFIKGSGLASFN